MRWRRIVFWFTFSTLALVVLALAWLWTADLGVFKPQLERLVSEEIGQEFSIDGELHIDLSRHTTLVAEDLRFVNPPWAEADDIINVARLEATIDLWALFRGLLIIEHLDMDDTRVLFINPGHSEPNWEKLRYWLFEVESSVEVLFGSIDIDRLQVRLESVERDRPLNLDIETFDQVYREDDYLDLGLDATLDGKVVRLDGELGTWDALLAGKDLRFDIGAVLDTFEFSARGRIDDLADPVRPELEVTASGPDIDDLTRLLGLGEEGQGDINLSGALTPLVNGPLTVDIKGNLGLTQIDSFGQIADLKSLRDIRVVATASGPDLGRVLRLAGIHEVRESPFMVKVDAEMKGEVLEVGEAVMVFADARIEGAALMPRFPSIDDAVISLQVEGPSLEHFRYITGIPGAASGPFSAAWTMDVREDGIEILDLRAKTELGELIASGEIGDPHDFLGSHARFRLKTGNLARTAGAYGVEGLPATPLEISGNAEYTGDGIRSREPIVATVPGHSLSVDGFFPFTAGMVGADFRLGVKGIDLAGFVNLFTEAGGLPALPYDVTSMLRIEERAYRFDGIDGTLGSNSISGDGLLVIADNLAGTRFDIRAGGAAFEELAVALADVDVDPGPFDFAASISFKSDAVEFGDVSLERQRAKLKLDAELGLPMSRRWLDFDLDASGRDIRSVLSNMAGLEPYEQPFEVKMKGARRGDRWVFENIDGAVGESGFGARGELNLEDSAARTDFVIDLSVPDLASIGTYDGRRFNQQAFSLNARAVGRAGHVTVDDLLLRIGASDLSGSIEYRAADVPEVIANVHSDRLAYLPLLEAAEREPDATPEFEDGRLIPDIAIPYDAMKKVNASIIADIDELQRDRLALSDIEFDARLNDGALDIRDLRLKALSGGLAARASLHPAGGEGEASLQVVAKDMAFGLLESNPDLAMTMDIDVNLRATGTDLRAMAGSADGVVYYNTHGGRLTSNPMIEVMYGNLLEEILNTINPFRATDPYTDFECLIVPVFVADGKVTGAPNIFASTSKIRMVAEGWLDLKTEAIKVSIRTTPRRILSVSAAELVNPYLQIVGTLASPRLAVDEAGVLITGGAAVATAGLSLLARGLWDRLSKSGDACKQVTEQALKELEGQLPDLVIE
jgi:hypothetical protein